MCDCIKNVSEKLKEHNTALKLPLLLDGGPDRVLIETQKADSKNRKKPMNLFASFCPFCGEKYTA